MFSLDPNSTELRLVADSDTDAGTVPDLASVAATQCLNLDRKTSAWQP